MVLLTAFSRIDFSTLEIADPDTASAATVGLFTDGYNVGDCNTDSLSSMLVGITHISVHSQNSS